MESLDDGRLTGDPSDGGGVTVEEGVNDIIGIAAAGFLSSVKCSAILV